MSIYRPDLDWPDEWGGGSDVWDTDAGAILSTDFFPVAAAPVVRGFSSPIILGPFAFKSTSTTTLDLTQTSPLSISGALGQAGTLGQGVGIVPTAAAALGGILAFSGDLQYALPTFNLSQSAPLGVSGAFGQSADLSYALPTFSLSQTAPVGLSGVLGQTGDLASALPTFNLSQTAAISVLGSITAAGDVASALPAFNLVTTGPVLVGGSAGVAGAVGIAAPTTRGIRSPLLLGPFSFSPTAIVQFNVQQTAPIAMAGSLAQTGNILAFEPAPWEFETPLALPVIGGTVGVSGDLQYKATYALVQTSPISVAGSFGAAGELGGVLPPSTWEFETPLAIGTVSGTMGVSGNLQFGQPAFQLTQTAPIGITGSLLTAGSVGFRINLIQSGQIGVTGTAGVTGSIAFRNGLDLFQTSAISVSGILAQAGLLNQKMNVVFQPLAVNGAMTAAGDLATTYLDFPTLTGGKYIYMLVPTDERNMRVARRDVMRVPRAMPMSAGQQNNLMKV